MQKQNKKINKTKRGPDPRTTILFAIN